jgi:hypothetical protein
VLDRGVSVCLHDSAFIFATARLRISGSHVSLRPPSPSPSASLSSKRVIRR